MYEANNNGEFITNHFIDIENKEAQPKPSLFSVWILHKCNRMILKLNIYNPISRYSYIDLQNEIKLGELVSIYGIEKIIFVSFTPFATQ